MDEVDIEAAERNIRDYLPGDENALELVAEVRRLQAELSDKEQEVDDKSSVGHAAADVWREQAEAAEAEVARLQGMLHPYVTRVQLFDRAEKAEAEVERLRELALIVTKTDSGNQGKGVKVETWRNRAEKAEAQRDAWRQMSESAWQIIGTDPGTIDEIEWLAQFDRLVAEQEGT